MNPLAQFVADTISASPEPMLYKDLYNATAPEDRPRLLQAVKEAESNGLVKREVAFSPEDGLTFKVKRVS